MVDVDSAGLHNLGTFGRRKSPQSLPAGAISGSDPGACRRSHPQREAWRPPPLRDPSVLSRAAARPSARADPRAAAGPRPAAPSPRPAVEQVAAQRAAAVVPRRRRPAPPGLPPPRAARGGLGDSSQPGVGARAAALAWGVGVAAPFWQGLPSLTSTGTATRRGDGGGGPRPASLGSCCAALSLAWRFIL